jgi:hypothetical protein
VGRLPRNARANLGRRAWQEDRQRTARPSATAVRRGKCDPRSKDGRREGDQGPNLEAMGSDSHARRGGCDCWSTARGAYLAGRVPGAPAALWSTAALISAGQRVFDCVFLQKVE